MNDKFFKTKLNEIDTMQLKLVANGNYLFKYLPQLSPNKLTKIVTKTNELASNTVTKLQNLMEKQPTNLQFIEMSRRLNSILNLQSELLKFIKDIKKTS